MNLTETVALIEALKSAGVTKFKSHEHDILLDSTPASRFVASPPGSMIQPDPSEKPPIVENPEATKRAMDLINTLKMTPEQLANEIFPDGAL